MGLVEKVQQEKVIKRFLSICCSYLYRKCMCFFAAVTVLLAISVYQLIVSDKLPSSSEAVPVVGQWTTCK